MVKKIIIVQYKQEIIKIYEEDIKKVFYLKPRALPKTPSF